MYILIIIHYISHKMYNFVHILENIQTVIHRFLQIIFSFLILYIVKIQRQDILHTVHFLHSNIAGINYYTTGLLVFLIYLAGIGS